MATMHSPHPSQIPTDGLSRVEDWLVRYLDDEPAPGPLSFVESLRTGLASSAPLLRRASDAESGRSSQPRGSVTEPLQGWTKLRLTQAGSVLTVRFRDSRLLREDDLRQAADELGALVVAGYHRLVLNFSGVERLSSQFLGAVAAAHRRCLGTEGGQLRLCSLAPDLAPIFTVTGLAASVPLFADEASALAHPWPARPALRPLPIDWLTAWQGQKPIFHAPDTPSRPKVRNNSFRAHRDAKRRVPLRLVSLTGPSRGRVITITEGPFLIGREPHCQLTIMQPTISRQHARIEAAQGRWCVRDLGTTNGTELSGRLLRDEAAELSHGDQLGFGPVRFRVEMGPGRELDELQAARWLMEDDDPEPTADPGPQASSLATVESDLPWTTTVIEGVLIVRPSEVALSDPGRLDAFRITLAALAESDLPRRVVIDLDRVGMLGSRAVALILAHQLRLDRQGGCLRLCRASVRVQALLDRIGLPVMIDVHPTLDAAVLSAWD